MFQLVPQLTVKDAAASRDFYVERFGFSVTQEDPAQSPDFVALEREEQSLFLVTDHSRKDEARDLLERNRRGVGVRLYFEVDDAREIYEALKAAGLAILRDIAYNEDEDYTEFSLEDPDGYEIGVYS